MDNLKNLPYGDVDGGCGCNGGEDNAPVEGGGMFRDIRAAFGSPWGQPKKLGIATSVFLIVFIITMIVIVFTDKGSDVSFKYISSIVIVISFVIMLYYDSQENAYSYE